MNNTSHVGLLSYSVNSDQLSEFFAEVGTVVSSKIIMDRDSGRSKGFGFVEMDTEQAAQDAIDKLNGKDLMGRNITIAIARPQEKRTGGGGGGFNNRSRY